MIFGIAIAKAMFEAHERDCKNHKWLLCNGAFTYVLLNALNGKAAFGDDFVTVEELKRCHSTEVPKLTQKHTGKPQSPANYGFGMDFNIGKIDKDNPGK